MAFEKYESLKNTINQTKEKKSIVKSTEWNALFNILGAQANHIDDYLEYLSDHIDIAGTKIPIGETEPAEETELWFKTLKVE